MQAIRLLLALLLGLGTGLLYDLLRPLRRAAGMIAAAGLVALFCLLTGAGIFLFAMGAGGREAGPVGAVRGAAGFPGLAASAQPLCSAGF